MSENAEGLGKWGSIGDNFEELIIKMAQQMKATVSMPRKTIVGEGLTEQSSISGGSKPRW